jgi:hypothetical protein
MLLLLMRLLRLDRCRDGAAGADCPAVLSAEFLNAPFGNYSRRHQRQMGSALHGRQLFLLSPLVGGLVSAGGT